MKIAFVGKGGSGKTTVTALFARWLAHQGKPVFVFDADINQHLFQALGGTGHSPIGLYKQLPYIKEYLIGKNVRIANSDAMIKTTPPGTGSRLIHANAVDPLLQKIMTRIDGVCMAASGELEQSDLGVKCFHSKSGVVELLLGHMIDRSQEYVAVDLTAGADPFASSILAKVDVICLVVEPSLQSLTVYNQFLRYAPDWMPPLMVIGNKVADDEDTMWLRQKVGTALVGCVPISSFVKRQSRGEQQEIASLEPDIKKVFKFLLQKIDTTPRNWATYQARNYALHRKNAESWANKSVGADLSAQIDSAFSYESAA